jgi:anti-sigma factor RsiW
MKSLTIKWQRLVHEGETCPRCGATGEEVQNAADTLRSRLAPFGIDVTLETAELDLADFQRDPDQSNRIWIAGRPLEQWLEGRVSHSPCSGVCGDTDCRTLELAGQTYETIPGALIIQAGLMAAAHLLTPAGTCGCGGPAGPCRPGRTR